MDFSNIAGGFGTGPNVAGYGSGFSSQSATQRQDPPVEHKLNVSLEELCSGCTKKMKISRKVLSADGRLSNNEKVVAVDVKPGWKAGTKVTFPKEGDQAVGKIPSDIVFVIGEKPHSEFERDGNNLRHKVRTTLKKALCGGEITIPTIDGETLKQTLSEVVDPSTIKVFPGHGMPISKQPGKRGDLVVSYDIVFPKNIKQKDKDELENILSSYQ